MSNDPKITRGEQTKTGPREIGPVKNIAVRNPVLRAAKQLLHLWQTDTRHRQLAKLKLEIEKIQLS